MALSKRTKEILVVAMADKKAAEEISTAVDAGGNTPAEAVADVATADADATYGAPEAALINELKAQLNAALAALRAAGLMEE